MRTFCQVASLVLLWVFLVTSNAACTPPMPQSPASSDTATPGAGEKQATTFAADSAIAGIVVSSSSQGAALAGVAVRAGRVHWNQQKSDGAVVFDAAHGPTTTSSADGSFSLSGLEPGDYALMVGDPMGTYEILSEPDGKAKIISVKAGMKVDLGRISIKLSW